MENQTIHHDTANNEFYTVEQGSRAYVKYLIDGDKLTITTTQVPKAIGGRGIAAALVEECYKYADSEGLKPDATCSYAIRWLEKH